MLASMVHIKSRCVYTPALNIFDTVMCCFMACAMLACCYCSCAVVAVADTAFAAAGTAFAAAGTVACYRYYTPVALQAAAVAGIAALQVAGTQAFAAVQVVAAGTRGAG